MIREDELLPFLEAISYTVTHELRPDLQSGHARKSADYLIQVLNRLVAQERDCERIAAGNLGRWEKLRQQLPLAGGAAAAVASTAAGKGIEQLELELDLIQRKLLDDRGFNELARGLKDPGAPQTAWFRQAVTGLFDMWEAVDNSVQEPAAKPPDAASGSDPEQLRARLGAYLEKKYPQLPKDAITALRIASGGSSKITALFSLRPNPVLPERLVLRQDLAVSLTSKSTLDEYLVVDRLFKAGLRLPQPILVEPDASILGGTFMIMTEVADSVPAGDYFAKERAQQHIIGPQFVREAAEELARLHRLTANPVASAGTTNLEAVEKAHTRWKSLHKPPYSVGVDLGFAWLESHPLPPNRPRCLIHGDYGVHNMMARDGHLAAVLDWELAQEDDPAVDLAEARMLMEELPWKEFVETYLAAGGDPQACDPRAVTYYCVWIFVVKFGMMLAEARAYYFAGARTNSLLASVATHSMDRILQHLARALKLATE